MSAIQGKILVVDDNEINRDLLSRQLQRQGHTVATAENGQQALEKMRAADFDLMLLDIMMPEMNGYQVLEHLRGHADLRHIPVIVISAVGEVDSVVRCIELGAEDYLFKPFNRVVLRARIGASLEKKYLRDQEQAYLRQLEAERAKSESLLLNILPQAIAERLKQGHQVIADRFDLVTVLFADIVNFTDFWSEKSPVQLVEMLNEIFSTFDRLAEKHNLEKIKTIGDAYMVVGGLPTPRRGHVQAIADMALDMREAMKNLPSWVQGPLDLRIGIDTGPVVAGVIGNKKFSYDLWGDTVNTASRMQVYGLPGEIQVTAATYQHLQDKYRFRQRGPLLIKGKGKMVTYLLQGPK
ncbi:MAG: response regulator [Chloroflexia bacterium]|nr:response regulator [Chloroflexia bacterium]